MLKDTLPQPSSLQFQKKINSFLKERDRMKYTVGNFIADGTAVIVT